MLYLCNLMLYFWKNSQSLKYWRNTPSCVVILHCLRAFIRICFFKWKTSCVICISIPRCKKVKPRFNWIKSFNSGQLKVVFAKNERGYRLKTINNRFWSLIILLLSVSSIWRKLLKNSLYFIIFLIFCFFKLMFHLQLVFTTGAFPENMKIVVFIIKILETGILSLKVTLRS